MVHPSRPAHYAIRVEGVLHEGWSPWFEGLRVSADGTQTVITGQLADQSALHGVLAKIRDLGMGLVTVRRLDGDGAEAETPAAPHRHWARPPGWPGRPAGPRCPASAKTHDSGSPNGRPGWSGPRPSAGRARCGPPAWPGPWNGRNRTESGAARSSSRARSSPASGPRAARPSGWTWTRPAEDPGSRSRRARGRRQERERVTARRCQASTSGRSPLSRRKATTPKAMMAAKAAGKARKKVPSLWWPVRARLTATPAALPTTPAARPARAAWVTPCTA